MAADCPHLPPACCGSGTLCTIASSVSNLAVTETTCPPPPLVTEHDLPCCPPKKIRMSGRGDSSQVACSSLQRCGWLGQPPLESCCERGARSGSVCDARKCVERSEDLSGSDVPSAVHSVGLHAGGVEPEKIDSCPLLVFEKVVPQPVKAVGNTGQGCCERAGGDDGVDGSHLPHPCGLSVEGVAERWREVDGRDVGGEGKAVEAGVALSPSPYHCHVMDSSGPGAGRERSSCWGSDREGLVLSWGGSSEDVSGEGQSVMDSITLSPATAAWPPAHCPQPHCSGHRAAKAWATPHHPSITGVGEGDPCSHAPQARTTDCAHVPAGPGLGVSSCRPPLQCPGTDPAASAVTSPPGVQCDAGSAGSCGMMPSPGCGPGGVRESRSARRWSEGGETQGTALFIPGTEADPESSSVLTIASNLDDDTDSLGCLESSSETSSSSSESSPRQSSVVSARVFHHRLQCGTAKASKGAAPSKALHRRKMPRYGLKTDALDDLIGVRRGGHKSRHHLNTACRSSFTLGAQDQLGPARDDLTIDDLPAVLLIHIFSFLPVITRVSCVGAVCRNWQAAVGDPSLWRRLDLRNLPRLNDDILSRLTSLSDRVSSLILSDGRSTLLTDNGVARVLQKCQYLTKVKLNRCFFLSDDAFHMVGKHCHGLVYLNLSGCFTVTDLTLLAISQGCPLLQDLGLGQCARITDAGMCAVAKGCRRLVSLRLDQCSKLTNRAVETLATCCPDLQFLHLLSCSLSDVGISHLSKLGKLQVLDISNMSHLSRAVVEGVVGCCPLLETLALSLNRTVDDQCLRQVVTACPRLRCLSCVACGLSDEGLHHIATHAKNLERLDVAWCADITDEGVAHISAACPRLRYLGVMRCPLITLATVERLMQAHPHILFSNFELESRRLLGRAAEQGLATSEG